MKDSQIVGSALAEVLPQTGKYWFQESHLLRLNLLLLVPLLSSSVSGYDGSLMNGLQSLPQWQSFFGQPTGALLGLVNAAQSIGSVLAIPLVGDLSDRFGRRRVLLAGIFLIVAATVIQAAAVNLPMFVISRLVVGFGGMFVVHPSPLLIAELAYPTHRGKYTSAFWTMYYLGAILASWTTFGTQGYASDWSWRIPSVLQAGLPLVQLAFWAWVPESPRWLVAQGRTSEAAAILARYHSAPSTDNNDDRHQNLSPLVTRELTEIVQTLHLEKATSSAAGGLGGWQALVATPGNRRRTLIAFCVGAFAQWNGIGIVSYYLTLVLDTIGITGAHDQTLINGGLQIFNFLAAVAAAGLVDRLGRRTLFIWSSVGMLVAYTVWTGCASAVAAGGEAGNRTAGIVVVVCLFVYYFHYDIAWTPLLFGYPTEIFPYSTRSKGLAVELLAIYGSLIVAAFANPIGIENIGWRYYIVYCVLLAIFLVVVYMLFPETKGYSLEEIAVIFDGDDAAVPVGDDEEGTGDGKAKETEILESEGMATASHAERV